MKNVLSLLVCVTIFFSCKNNAQTPEVKTVVQQNVATTQNPNAVYATTTLEVKGMTCAMGCAAVIEKKLNKTQGVKTASVDFEQRKAVINYDTKTTSVKALQEVIAGCADGKTYSSNVMASCKKKCKKTCDKDATKKACQKKCKESCQEKCQKSCHTDKK